MVLAYPQTYSQIRIIAAGNTRRGVHWGKRYMNIRNPRSWMWAEACEFLERAEQLHRQFFRLGAPRTGVPSWEPPVDIIETADEIWVLVALPGVLPDQVEVLLEGNSLRVVGRRTISAPAQAGILRLEIPHGRFERRIPLPPGRFTLGRRNLANGCLTVVFEKTA